MKRHSNSTIFWSMIIYVIVVSCILFGYKACTASDGHDSMHQEVCTTNYV